MGKVRWIGWMMAIATAFVISGGQSARADVASDKPAAIVVYPKIIVDTTRGVQTAIRLTNTNLQAPVNLRCFYVNANSHCLDANGIQQVCGVVGLTNLTTLTGTCAPGRPCTPGWLETDFNILLTPGQPVEWDASEGLEVPLPNGVCIGNHQPCGSSQDCLFPPSAGGFCSSSNAGTAVPPVGEDPFVGELRCIETNNLGQPIASNDVKGEAIIETLPSDVAGVGTNTFDVASYNAIGIEANGVCDGNQQPCKSNQDCVLPPEAGGICTFPAIDPNAPLTLGPGSAGEYNGCPGVLILNHFFEGAIDPVASTASPMAISTDLTLVPCTVNFESQLCGTAIVQYLVFNEFEQRFSTSKTASCWQEINLCNIDTTQCTRSIFSAAVSGTLTGQTRLTPIPASPIPGLVLPTQGLLGVAIERHTTAPLTATAPFTGNGNVHSAAFNLHFAGSLANPDTITIP